MDTRPAAVLGLDVGTSSTKCVLASPDQPLILERATAGYPWRAGSPVTVDDYWSVVHREITRIEQQYAVQAVAVSTQMYSLIAVDGTVIGWNAPWTGDPAAFRSSLEALEGTGAQPDPIFPVFKLLGGAEFHPWGLKAALLKRLSGVLAVDPAEASATGMYDVCRQRWIPAMADRYGRTDSLPEVVAHNNTVGTVLPELHFRDQFMVVPGLGDGVSASFRGWPLGSTAANLGTSVAVRAIHSTEKGSERNNEHPNGRHNQWQFRLDERHVVYGGISRAGFGVLQRFRDARYPVAPQQRPLPLFFPWLEGIQWPLWDPTQPPALVGLEPHHSFEDIGSAIWQSVVYMVAAMIEEISTDTYCLTAGGGVLEEGFLEALSRCVTRTLAVPDHAEFFAAEGAAQSALEALGSSALPPPTLTGEVPPSEVRDTAFHEWNQIAWRSV